MTLSADASSLDVTREIDGGLESISVKLPVWEPCDCLNAAAWLLVSRLDDRIGRAYLSHVS